MSKITPEQAEYITNVVYRRYEFTDTDDNWESIETEFDFPENELAFTEWGWITMDVEFGLKSWSRGDDASFIIDFDYIGIVASKKDLEDGEKSLELFGSECNICNYKF